MSILIENETNLTFDFDDKELIEKVIENSLNFIDFPYETEINVILTNNENIRQINKEYREMDAPTDVLSFPLIHYKIPADFSILDENITDYFNPETGEVVLGDIVISIDKVVSQANEYGHSVKREMAFLIVHSMLHLFGFDHIEENERIEMEKLQNLILKELDINR